MGEILFQLYVCIVCCVLILNMLNLKWKFRECPGRYLGLIAVWWMLNTFEWYMVVKAEQIPSVLFQMFFVISRFAAQYLFLYYVYFMCRDSFLKVFFALFLSTIVLESLYIFSQVILQQFRKGWRISSDTLGDNLWLLALLTGLFLVCIPGIRRLIRFYRKLEIKMTWPALLFAAAIWMLLCSGTLPNRVTNRYYGEMMALYIVLLCGGSFLFGALVFWNAYETEKRKKYFRQKQREFLVQHRKTLEQQMLFSRKMQKELEDQLKAYQEGRFSDRKEAESYYRRILEIVRTPFRESYFQNPILDELLEAQIGKWREAGAGVCVRRRNLRISEKDTLKWMEIVYPILDTADKGKLQAGDLIEISMDTSIGKDVVSLTIQRQNQGKGKRDRIFRKDVIRRLRRRTDTVHGQVAVDNEDGKETLMVLLDHFA